MIDTMQATTAPAALSILTFHYLYSHIIDGMVFTWHSSVIEWHETDFQLRLVHQISSDLHSVAVVGVIIGN